MALSNEEFLEKKLQHIKPKFHDALRCALKPEKEYHGFDVDEYQIKKRSKILRDIDSEISHQAQGKLWEKYKKTLGHYLVKENYKETDGYRDYIQWEKELLEKSIRENPDVKDHAKCLLVGSFIDTVRREQNSIRPLYGHNTMQIDNAKRVSKKFLSKKEFTTFDTISDAFGLVKSCYGKSLKWKLEDDLRLISPNEELKKINALFTEEFIEKINIQPLHNESAIKDTYTYDYDTFDTLFCSK